MTTPQTLRLSMPHKLLVPVLAVVSILECPPLLAQEVDDAAKHNSISAPQAEYSWMSGGVGDDARREMRKAAVSYNLHLVFSGRDGNYLASIPFSVRQNGREIYSGITEGPLLYLKLPAGAYQVSAEIDGIWQSKRIQVSPGNRPAKMMFVAKAQ